MKRVITASIISISSFFTNISPSLAGSYDALCPPNGGCNVVIGDGVIVTPQGRISTDRILSWSLGGNGSSTDVGLGVGLTLFFGLPGLFGFGAQNHDYQYSINYLNVDGTANTVVVAFVNDEPAKRFEQELIGATGLTMGMQNTKLKESTEKSTQNTSNISPELEIADQKDLFFEDSPNPRFKVGLQDWVVLNTNFRGYDFKYSPENTTEQGRFFNIQVFQQKTNDPSYYFVQTIRLDCRTLLSSYYLIDAPPEYRQVLNQWFKPKPLIPDSPNSKLAKIYCKNKNFGQSKLNN
jgi:hypothetical protein